MIVAAAGMFNTGDALVDYINASNPRDEERAISRMRSSSLYMGFALGGAPLRLCGSTAGTAIYRTTFAGMAGANSVLLYHDAVKRAANGDTSAYMDIPVDLAFIALGSTGFIRTFSGTWKAVKLPLFRTLFGVTCARRTFHMTAPGISLNIWKSRTLMEI